MKPRIAVIDDESRMVEILTMVLQKAGYHVAGFDSSAAAEARLAKDRFDLVITDLKMPPPDGLEILRAVKTLSPETPVVLLTAHATVATAIAAMKDGAFDYVEKPFDNDELKALAQRALELGRLSRENRYLRGEVRRANALDAIVAESEAMKEVLEMVRRAAPSRSTVLITGESGTGKELIARALHYASDRVGAPFVAANCKAFAAGVLESELFGHEKGAFTGASRTRAGLFEQADGGTLFLDEIGDVDGDFQAKLLRVLQERTLRRVGGSDAIDVDVRIVAATHRDLKAAVADGRLREDLYFRLAVIPIHVSPLRERREDILPLAAHFLARFNRELGREIEGWDDDVAELLVAFDWPGNVRELENTMERAVVLTTSSRLCPSDLMLDDAPRKTPAAPRSLRTFLDDATAVHIRAALEATGGRRAEAAERLGIDRVTLYRLMRKHRIE